MNNKSKKEKIFIIFCMCAFVLIILCMAGCGGSCLGFSWGCESEEGLYDLKGCSYVSDGCGSTDSCFGVCGEIEMEGEYINDAEIINCSNFTNDCDGTSGCYNGCVRGKGVDCGDCLGIFGSADENGADELAVGCVDGCFTCADTDGDWGYLFSIIYELLDLGGN